jgi:hypothetical protein
MSIFGSVNIRGASTDLDAWVTPMHSLMVADPVRLVGPSFPTGTTIDTNFWVTSLSATSTAALAGGVITLDAHEAGGAYAQLKSARRARFMFAAPNLYRGYLRIPSGAPALGSIWGAVDPTNWQWTQGGRSVPLGDANVLEFDGGFYFEGVPGSPIQICYRSGTYYTIIRGGSRQDVGTTDPTSATGYSENRLGPLNGDVTSWILDNDWHAYEIIYFMASAHFFIDGVFIGSLTPQDAPFTRLQLHTFASSHITPANYGGSLTGPYTVEIGANTILRLGQEHSAPKTQYLNTTTDTLLKRGSGELHRVVVTDNGGSAFTIYDNTTNSGTILAVIDPAKTVGTLELGAQFEIGLYIDFGGVAPKITVVYE